jgi:hypothetical protein
MMLPAEYDETRARVLELGLEALHRIKGDDPWRYWLLVMNAVALLTTDVCTERGFDTWEKGLLNKRCASKIVARIDAWEKTGQRDINRPTLSKQERHSLRELYKHPEIIKWRDEQLEHKKRRLNHPSVVIREYAAAKRDRGPGTRTELATTKKKRDEHKSAAEWKTPDNIARAEDALVQLLQYRPIQEKSAVLKRLVKKLGIVLARATDR